MQGAPSLAPSPISAFVAKRGGFGKTGKCLGMPPITANRAERRLMHVAPAKAAKLCALGCQTVSCWQPVAFFKYFNFLAEIKIVTPSSVGFLGTLRQQTGGLRESIYIYINNIL